MSHTPEPSGTCWIGIDGTRIGWSVCIIEANGDVQLITLTELDHIWEIRRPSDIRAIGIDMPLALAIRATKGGRNCEREARRILTEARKKAVAAGNGIRRRGLPQTERSEYEGPFVGPSSIFTPPSRPALETFARGATHKEVSEANRRSNIEITLSDDDQSNGNKRQKFTSESDAGLGLSIQAFNIMKKILELDKFVAAGMQKGLLQFLPPNSEEEINGKTYLFECHPELAFLSSQPTHHDRELENHEGIHSKTRTFGRGQRVDILMELEPFVKHKFEKKRQIKGMLVAESNRIDLVEHLFYFKPTNHVFTYKGTSETSAIPTDDLLDSMICAVTAQRFCSGKAFEIGGSTTEGQREVDSRGIPMSIFA